MRTLKHIALSTVALATTGIIGLQPIAAQISIPTLPFTHICKFDCTVQRRFAQPSPGKVNKLFTLDDGKTFLLTNSTTQEQTFKNSLLRVNADGTTRSVFEATTGNNYQEYYAMQNAIQYKNSIVMPYITYRNNMYFLHAKVFTPGFVGVGDSYLRDLPSDSLRIIYNYSDVENTGFLYTVMYDTRMGSGNLYLAKYLPTGQIELFTLQPVSDFPFPPTKFDMDKDGNLHYVKGDRMYTHFATNNYKNPSSFPLEKEYLPLYDFAVSRNGNHAFLMTTRSSFLHINLLNHSQKLVDMSEYGEFSSGDFYGSDASFEKAGRFVTFVTQKYNTVNGSEKVTRRVFALNPSGKMEVIARIRGDVTETNRENDGMGFFMNQFGDIFLQDKAAELSGSSIIYPLTKIDFTY